eukprot:366570-Chlamydomonas_euryale.AAC.2
MRCDFGVVSRGGHCFCSGEGGGAGDAERPPPTLSRSCEFMTVAAANAAAASDLTNGDLEEGASGGASSLLQRAPPLEDAEGGGDGGGGGGGGGGGVPRALSRMVKPANDAMEYRHLKLPNGMVVLLVSDPEADKAAAAMDVRTAALRVCIMSELRLHLFIRAHACTRANMQACAHAVHA